MPSPGTRGGRVRVSIALDTRELDRGAKRAEGTLDRMGKRGSQSMRGLGKSVVGVVAGFGAMAAAKGAITTTETLAKSTLGLHKAFGLTIEDASRWAAITQARGVDGKQLTQGFKALSVAVTAARRGGEAQVAVFKRLGITQGDLARHGNDLDWVLGRVADGLHGMPSGTLKADTASKLLGRTWTTLRPLLAGGNDEMRKQLALADKYGVTFKDKAVKSVQDYVGAQREAKLASMGMQVALATHVVPALTSVTARVTRFVAAVRSGDGSTRSWVIGIAAFVGVVKTVLIVAKVATAVKTLSASILVLNLAMRANPIIAVASVLAVLGVAFVTAYKHSASFRRGVDGVFTFLRRAVGWALTPMITALDVLTGTFSSMLGVLGHVPGFGWAKDAQKKIDEARKAARDLVASLREVPEDKKVNIKVRVNFSGLSPNLFGGPGPRGDGLGRAIAAKVRSSVPRTVTVRGSGLKGARMGMAPFAAVGGRFGLGVSSGRRPGAITSSGNQSWHSTGEAIDLAGSPRGMLGFFRFAKRQWGPRLAELIYTPGGAGIKDGASHVFGGKVARDHHDHVHLAYDLGMPGQGDGEGRVVGAFKRAVRTTKAGPKAALALFEAGHVESGMRNLSYGDRDSQGALQLRVGLHGEKLAMDPYRSAVAFLTRGFTGRGGAIGLAKRNPRMSAGQVAQAVQGSEFPGRYDQVRGHALRHLGDVGGRGGGGSSTGGASAGGGGSSGGSGGGSGAEAPTALETRLARADDMLARAEGTPGFEDDKRALKARRSAMQKRLRKINVALKKGNLSKGTRVRLLTERAQLVRDIRETSAQIGDKPTPGQLAELGVATASLTPGVADDYAAAGALFGVRAQELAEAKKSGNADKIKEAIDNLKSAGDALKAAADAIADKRMETLNAALMIARVDTPNDTRDDRAVLAAQLGLANTEYLKAKRAGDAAGIIKWGGEVESLRQAIASLNAAITENTATINELLKSENERLRRELNVSQAQYGTIERFLAEMVSRAQGAATTLRVASPGVPGRVAAGMGGA